MPQSSTCRHPRRGRRALSSALVASAMVLVGFPGAPADAVVMPMFSVNNASVVEGNSGTQALRFTVILNPAPAATASVDYHAVNGDAVAPDDFSPTAGTLEFVPGQTSATVEVMVEGDRLDEPDEGLSLVLSGASGNVPVGVGISADEGTGTIRDDDVAPQLSIDDVIIPKDSGQREAELTVRLFPPSSELVTVEFATRNGDAVAPADYAHEAGLLEFSPGDGTEKISVMINGDDIAEDDETFTVELFNESGATIADGEGEVLITDNDITPQLSVDDVRVLEGDSGTRNATFTVTRFPSSADEVTVEYSTANDTATAPDDYAHKAGLLEFGPGETTATVTVAVKGDVLEEVTVDPADDFIAEETFTVNLANPSGGANLADDEGLGTILDDDVESQLSVDDVRILEGNHGTTDAVFTVTRFPRSQDRVTVEFSTAGRSATAGEDFEHKAVQLVFDPGDTKKQVAVKIKGDQLDETRIDDADELRAEEIFLVELTNPSSNARIADDEGLGTILDDDLFPRVTVDDVTVKETDSGHTEATFTLRANPAPQKEARVAYVTVDDSAHAPGDYQAESGWVVFRPGDRTRTVTVKVKGDRAAEVDEEFSLLLADTVDAIVEDDSGTGIIANDDLDPGLTVDDVTVSEGDKEAMATFVVTLSRPALQPVTFTAATEDDTASSPDDYTGTGATLTIAPGEHRLKVEVPIVGDDEEEEDETFKLTLADAEGGFLIDAEAVGVIVDDDRPGAARVGMAATSSGGGYWLAASDGDVFAFGDAEFKGSVPLTGGTYQRAALNRPVVDIERTANDQGYWLVASDGGVFSYGNARFHGSTGDIRLNMPIVGMAPTPRGAGYWLVAADGGIFSFGDASFYGSTGAVKLNRPIVGMAPTPSGRGYWLVASDGGIFAFGDAPFYGSTGNIALNRPIVGMGASPMGRGYWLAASDGGIFSFGDAPFHGSTGNVKLNRPIVGMGATPSGRGYWLAASDGGIFAFGDAPFHGSTGGARLRE